MVAWLRLGVRPRRRAHDVACAAVADRGFGPRRSLDRGEIQRKVLHIAMGALRLLLACAHAGGRRSRSRSSRSSTTSIPLPLYARGRIFRGEARTNGPRSRNRPLSRVASPILILVLHARLEIVAAAWGLLAFGDGLRHDRRTGHRRPASAMESGKTWTRLRRVPLHGLRAAWFLYGHTLRARAAAGLGAGASAAARTPGPLAMIATATRRGERSRASRLGARRQHRWCRSPRRASSSRCRSSIPASWASSRALGPRESAVGARRERRARGGAAYAARSVSVVGRGRGRPRRGTLFSRSADGARSMMLVVFFVRRHGARPRPDTRARKSLGIAQEQRRDGAGRRTPIANCGVGALLAFIAGTSACGASPLLGARGSPSRPRRVRHRLERDRPGVRPHDLPHHDPRAGEAGDRRRRVARGDASRASRPPPSSLAGGAGRLGLVNAAGSAVVGRRRGLRLDARVLDGARWERSKLIDNEAINGSPTRRRALFAVAMSALLPSLGMLA